MRRVIYLLFFSILLTSSVFAINSTNYQAEVEVVAGGGNPNSTHYFTTYAIIGGGGNASSANYTTDYVIQISYDWTGITAEEENDDDSTNENLDQNTGGSTQGSSSNGLISGGTVSKPTNFTANPFEINEKLRAGESKEINILIKNIGKSNSFSVTLEGGIKKYVFLGKNKFTLSKKESEILKISIKPPNKEGAVYRGNILIKASDLEIKIPVNLIVESKKQKLMDLRLKILEYYIEPGKKVNAKIELFNLGNAKRVDVYLKYRIDKNGEVLVSSKETVAVETSLYLIRSLKLPKEFKYGKYSLKIIAEYGNETVLAKKEFRIVEDASKGTTNFFVLHWPYILISILGIILILLLLPLINRFFKELKLVRKNRGYSKEYGFISKKSNKSLIAINEIKEDFKKEGVFKPVIAIYHEFYFFRSYRRVSKKLRKMKKDVENKW